MANDPTGAGSLLGKLYFVLLHFIFFLLGFYIIQLKAKQLENGERPKETKKSSADRNIYTSLNSYIKSSYLFSKSSVRIIVDRWLTALEHDVKKELKNISIEIGREKLVSSIKIERTDEVPFTIENIKQHWQNNEEELVLEAIIHSKALKFKVVNSNKEISYFVLPPVNLKAMLYLEIGDETNLMYIEVKALRELKLSLPVVGKHKDICSYIAQALNVVLMKPKRLTDLVVDPVKSNKSSEKIELPKEQLLVQRSKSLKEISIQTDNSHNHDEDDLYDGENVLDWSAAATASPRIASHHQQKSKSLSRLDSVPKYIQREHAFQQHILSESHNSLNSSTTNITPTVVRRPPSESFGSETSSVLFEPITPLSFKTDGAYSASSNPNISPFFPPIDSFSDDTEEIEYQPLGPFKSTPMTPVDGFQAMHDSLEQTFYSSGTDASLPTTVEVPLEKPKRAKKGSIADEQASSSPKIQNAIEPKYTTADSAQTIKTPILKSKEARPPGRNGQASQLTKNNVMRHSFHHGVRPKFDAQSLGSLSNRSESPTPLRGSVSHSALNSAIGYIPNTSSALVIEVTEKSGVKYYRIPPNMAKKDNYPFKGQKLHVYNDHIFVATHFNAPMPSCTVCNLPLRRVGKQGYACRDCKAVVHKRCHCKIFELCPMTSLPNMKIDYIGATDV